MGRGINQKQVSISNAKAMAAFGFAIRSVESRRFFAQGARQVSNPTLYVCYREAQIGQPYLTWPWAHRVV
jgi:hypothetical protein